MSESQLRKSPRELRDELEALIRDDLIGPIGDAEEELAETPVDRYVLGMLAPRFRFGSPLPAPPDGGGNEDGEDSIAFDALPEDDLADGGIMADEGEDGRAEDRPPALDQLVPSAFGLTFALDSDCQELRVRASWGAYSKATSEERLDRDGKPQRVWRRRQCGGAETIKIVGPGALASFAPDPAESEVVVRGLVRDRGGQRLVSLFLVNGQFSDGGRSVPRWLCQASLTVEHPAGEPVFVRRRVDAIGLAPEVDRAELTGLEMLYRDTVELAVGHGVGVQATLAPGRLDRGRRLQTAAMPAEDVPRTDAPGAADFTAPAISEPFTAALAALDMKVLSEVGDAQLPALLSPLADAYSAWIDAQEQRIDEAAARLAGHEPKAREHVAQARVTLGRIRAGIASLADPDVAEAFRFANHAMWQQRVHTLAGEARRRDSALKLHAAVEAADEPGNRSWRPFQLAFVLLNVPALADPSHPERVGAGASVDLLFFPTGGGKTEAYLGLTAFAIAIRRLQGDLGGREGRDGVAVLMRYTLRLLTLQQFQRAAALLCACELQRRRLYGKGETVEQRRWGSTPMRIGLWVGQASTPNRTEDAEQWVKQARQRSGGVRGASPMQLARCPWCGSELQGGRDIEVDTDRGRTILSCSDISGQCAFTPRNSPDEGLPVVVVDDEVYRLLPALVIATVDKFARMPWEGRAQALFGQVSRHCDRHGYLTPGEEHPGSHPKRRSLPAVIVTERDALRPPDLVIQDELHLISGPLGSLVGLYETAVDELCAWTVDGKRLRPKVIASTATIRRAGDQVARLFDRRLQVFPPPGLDARDSFFALQRDADEDRDQRPGRRYLGVCAPGRRFKQVLIRVYVAQLEAAWTVLGRQPGAATDAYMTLVGYFNSLRELGGMRRLVEDDVQSRMFGGGGEGRGRLILEELTSRKSASDIPQVLDQLGVSRESQEDRRQRKDGETWSIDVLLATNMISVGVDVQRLGAMVVAGQPKSTSEYIQATSRVGRQFPGLVLAVYNWARPRDLSHYETFCHYHRTLYRQVEAFSVTPFAPRALDRGLTGVLVSLLRLSGTAWNPNPGAGLVDPADPLVARAREAIRARADDQIGPGAADALEERISVQLDEWKKEAAVGQRTLVYRKRGKSDSDVSLLQEPGIEGWNRWTVPTSMRNVETAVPLKLREHGISAPVEDWVPPERAAPLPKDGAGGVTMRDRSQIGELRPSQLMHTYGVGATVELPELTTLVLGLDDWPRALGQPVSEPRLLAAVRAAVGSQVEQLLTPPVVPEGDSSGVPVAPFPRWLRCPVCSRLAPIDHGVFTLKVDPWRPERTKYAHEGCPKTKSTRPPTAFPARYMMACQNGHLDDFPWVEFLHGSLPCKGTLKLIELGSSGRAGDVQLQCDECGRRRRLSQAFGDDAAAFLPPRCRGRHPHLGISEPCQLVPATLLLGASNAWFPVQSSALAIPSQASELAQRIDEAWATLSIYPPGLDILDANLKAHPDLKALRPLADKLGLQAVHDAIEARRQGLEDGEVEDLLTPEWRVLCAPDNAPDQPDFKLRAVGPPAPLVGLLADIMLVERLREVSALRGFTRINAPDELGSQGGTIVRLSREAPRWLPCSEVRGEGIFIRFPEEAVLEWEARYRQSGAAGVLREGNRAWRERRGLDGDGGWPGERYVLLHSFAHALMRELALECGYTASSIRERLYATSPGEEGEPMAGVLLYTAAPDSEGTLGGLVSLGEPDQLGPLLRQALERAQLCSSDPLCSEHDPRTDASVHAAACHACQFASETSCERGNRFLDRSTLVRTLGAVDVAYFPTV